MYGHFQGFSDIDESIDVLKNGRIFKTFNGNEKL